ncbi:hypothetical protein B0H67DRAFT_591628 [Lasiosphaeris hirsuta]|uniref:Uncharacterized protein n=1 Tax=Lasiosphaeris hirsuta TaxID=260670 RepID=A0AA39ZVX8_9PEZI|nr:hypothetical protein B0H67DRAFT_591628 [Lasiosphaeris hirsuta]
MVLTTRTLGITPNTEMGAVDFGPVDEAAAEWTRDSTHGGKYTDVFIAVRNLLTAAGDGADSSAVTATAIANFIRDEARKPASANYDARRPGSADDRELFVIMCWRIMDYMACCIPPHHPWHAALVGAVRRLHARGDESIFSSPDKAYRKWSDLFELCYNFWDFYDSMLPFEHLTDEEHDSPEAHKLVTEWKNWISWFAQMPRDIATPSIAVRAIEPIEEPADSSPTKAECEFWTACEWLIHTAGTVFDVLMARRAGREQAVRPRLSMERWELWKRRLAELAAPDGVDAETKQRVARAIASMEAAEAAYRAAGGRGQVEEKGEEKD